MPKANPPRTIRSEMNLARRMAVERSERGQSYEVLARLMSKAGCPIQGSALYRIEKGDPPRKVSVDELVALSTIWGLSVEDLLMPLELRDKARAQEFIDQLAHADAEIIDAIERMFDARIGMNILDDELFEYVVGHRDRLMQEKFRSRGRGLYWNDKIMLHALVPRFYELLDLAVRKQLELDEDMANAVENEAGHLVNPETGELISVLFGSLGDENG